MSDKYEQLKRDIKKAASPYNGFMKRTMDGSIIAIQDLQDENANFITTIESQKEEIEKMYAKLDAKLTFVNMGSEDLRWAIQEKQAAITELAVKGLKEMVNVNSEFVSSIKLLSIAQSTISEIERLSHE